MTSDIRKTMLRNRFQAFLKKAKAAERKGDEQAAKDLYAKALVVRKRLMGEMTDKERERRAEIRDTRIEEATPPATNGEASIEDPRPQQGDDGFEERIEDALVAERPATTWDDIGGLTEVKERIREAIRLPWIEELPDFVEPWRGILLYGPPGTGKTMLARAATNELDASFFQLDAGTVLSKYYGESSRIIAELFEAARERAPSVIFVDEVDSLTPARTGDVHEETRRALNQFLQEQQGLKSGKEDVLLIGATNAPWDIDEAQVSRFQKRIHVPLPDEQARRKIIGIHLQSADADPSLVDELAEATEGFTGRDLQAITQEAIMTMVRDQNPQLSELEMAELKAYRLDTRPLSEADFVSALEQVKGVTDEGLLERYAGWDEQYGRY